MASPLIDRVAAYPDWHHKPPVQAVGDRDLIYPDWFAGGWQVTTTLVDMLAPLAPEVMTPGFTGNRQFLDQPVSFRVRFVQMATPQRGLGLGDRTATQTATQLVSDRAYNGKQVAAAYLGDRAVLNVKVDPKNPNRQITLLRGDQRLVSIGVGRDTASPNVDQFVTSELFKQEFRGTDTIYFNEVENTTVYTRQKEAKNTEPAIVADQMTAIYLSPQDPDYFKTVRRGKPLSDPQPVALYRYRMEFYPDPA
jgi:hypothetical protein